jgi:diphosphomevalonate decarboxylase
LCVKVRAFRNETGIPLCFTLDAGPNLHLLYPEANHKTVQDFIQSDLATYCENNYWINDAVGTGPSEI